MKSLKLSYQELFSAYKLFFWKKHTKYIIKKQQKISMVCF